ncbi:hypothetical protein EJ06DRAFT_560456 [Trichodelitschia bisporula]|uniref:Uncharacterized protein n=1 Tax=Trichodelitschia bisporula TaxID=703511 RepID=A0A6G1HJ19_9PEZI|nr:hypothetical protein EJ06DRAFT_560456 [Trichodelitschia bisporula]
MVKQSAAEASKARTTRSSTRRPQPEPEVNPPQNTTASATKGHTPPTDPDSSDDGGHADDSPKVPTIEIQRVPEDPEGGTPDHWKILLLEGTK